MNWIDLGILSVLIISGLLAYWRGFMYEVLSIINWIISIVLTISLLPTVTPLVTPYIPDVILSQLITGCILFIGSILICGLISGWTIRRLSLGRINMADRSLGFLYGLIRGGILISAGGLVLYQVFGTGVPPLVADSRLAAYSADGSRFLVHVINAVAPEPFRLNRPPKTFLPHRMHPALSDPLGPGPSDTESTSYTVIEKKEPLK